MVHVGMRRQDGVYTNISQQREVGQGAGAAIPHPAVHQQDHPRHADQVQESPIELAPPKNVISIES